MPDLTSLPSVLLAHVASFAFSRGRAVKAALAPVCPALRDQLSAGGGDGGAGSGAASGPGRGGGGENDVWRTLCNFMHGETVREWPDMPPETLHDVLDKYAPLEGFYTVASAFPWGKLLLLRFRGGRFVGEVIEHVPPEEGEAGEGRGRWVETVRLCVSDHTRTHAHAHSSRDADPILFDPCGASLSLSHPLANSPTLRASRASVPLTTHTTMYS